MSTLAIGVDIGGTKTAAGLVGDEAAVLARLDAPTPASEGPDEILRVAADLARRLIASAPGEVGAVGVGSAGAIDSARRTVIAATNHLRGWTGTDIGTRMEAALGVPVSVDNDVHAHAVGEAVAGAGQGFSTVLVAAVGTGIGGAVVIDGAPLTGAHGVAGHLGHVPVSEADGMACPCGLTGHLEAVASGGGLAALYQRAGGDAGFSARQVVAAAAADPLARRCVETAASALGTVLAGVINVVDPDLVIIAGGLSAAGPLWWDAVRAAAGRSVLPLLRETPLVRAKLGGDAAIVGAAHRALRRAEALGGQR